MSAASAAGQQQVQQQQQFDESQGEYSNEDDVLEDEKGEAASGSEPEDLTTMRWDTGVVVRIGSRPLIDHQGIKVRFSYRVVWKVRGLRAVVRLGDKVEFLRKWYRDDGGNCHFTTKAWKVRHVNNEEAARFAAEMPAVQARHALQQQRELVHKINPRFSEPPQHDYSPQQYRQRSHADSCAMPPWCVPPVTVFPVPYPPPMPFQPVMMMALAPAPGLPPQLTHTLPIAQELPVAERLPVAQELPQRVLPSMSGVVMPTAGQHPVQPLQPLPSSCPSPRPPHQPDQVRTSNNRCGAE